MTELERLRREHARLKRRFERLQRTAARQAEFADRNKRLMYRGQQDLGAEIAEHKRTADELRAASGRAEAATAAKSRFLANMSHEIRTPANAVVGLLDLIAAETSDPQLHDRVEVARNAARDLVAIVDDLLDISEIEAEKTRLVNARFSPWDAIDDTVAVLAPAAAKKGLALRVRIGSLPSAVDGDAGRFRQVLRNLLSNAIKFTDRGHVEVACQVWDGQLVTRVTDTGPGIPPDLVARLFTPFDRLSMPDHGPSGRGLGLSISQHLARLMGGDVTVESAVGQGSTFQFRCEMRPATLPRARWLAPVHVALRDDDARRHLVSILDDLGVRITPSAGLTITDEPQVPGVLALAHMADTPPGSRPTLRMPFRRRAVEHLLSHMSGAAAASASPQLRPVSVLLVEDNTTNQLVASSMLRHLGCDVTIADDGAQALELLDEASYDVILMDCQMPVLDGYEATRRIRADGRHANTPIVALTAHALASDEQRCRDAGMNGYLAKPIRLADLRSVLARYGGREAI